jgi:hypothetical protein
MNTLPDLSTLSHPDATAIESDRSALLRRNTDRYSRHWYDLAMLTQHEIGTRALQRTDLLEQVIQVKSALFAVSGVNYVEVAKGGCKLVPSDALGSGSI